MSVDGPPAVQQQQRGMAVETFKGLGILESVGIPFRITTVVTQANAAKLDQLVLDRRSRSSRHWPVWATHGLWSNPLT